MKVRVVFAQPQSSLEVSQTALVFTLRPNSANKDERDKIHVIGDSTKGEPFIDAVVEVIRLIRVRVERTVFEFEVTSKRIDHQIRSHGLDLCHRLRVLDEVFVGPRSDSLVDAVQNSLGWLIPWKVEFVQRD